VIDKNIQEKGMLSNQKISLCDFQLAADTKGFPYNDSELMKRAHEQKLNEHQMRPYNEFAIKLMRRFKQLKEQENEEM
jgi:hypothetical protein